ncbi:chaperonin 10-like protein [Mycena capillaripes]|nr:chaperonin 10-like protein [Mycena capillaripes]
MSTQQAILVQSPKAPFSLGSTEIPSPAKGEVLVKVMSVGLNPGNWKQREYNVMIDEYPAVLGNDVAGVIEELGDGVQGWKKGDRVFAQTLAGGFQQFATVPTALLIPIPENVNFDDVATIPIAFTTACVGLFAPAPIGLGLNPAFSWDKPQQGESALVIGGATSVGQFAIQLFKFLGFTRIVVYASKAHFDYLRQLGATECIDRAAVPLDSLSTHLSLTSAVNVVYHTVDPTALSAAYDCVAEGGRIVSALHGTPLDRKPAVTFVSVRGFIAGADIMSLKSKTEDVLGFLATPQHSTFGKLIMENLPKMLEKGIIVANRYEVLPNGVAGILEGMGRLQKETVSGVKLVAHPQDPST